MECYIIEGGSRLSGEVAISGAKNAVLPILAATITRNESTISGIPFLSDVSNTLHILDKLGMDIITEGNSATLINRINSTEPDKNLCSLMRSSILFAGALLGRYKETVIYKPGGCRLGNRPIDLHLWAFEQLGAEIECLDDRIICKGSLKGTDIALPIVSVGVTENIILAAINACGTTTIRNAAIEPEIDDLINYINKSGGKVRRHKNTITIEGTSSQNYCNHSIIPDRIETGTYMAMAAATGGELFIKNVCPSHIEAVIDIFKNMGCIIKTEENRIYIEAPSHLYSIPEITTKPYPYFPTDMQPQITAVLAKAEGRTIIHETLFSARNKHISQLNKMNARIREISSVCFEITGTDTLKGSEVYAQDLRGGISLVIAALSAEGESRVYGTQHIARGYESLCSKVQNIGGNIKLIKQPLKLN